MSQRTETVGPPAAERSRQPKRRGSRSGTGALVAGRAAVLPGSRAILGAFLCTLAALLTFGAYSRANRPPTTRYFIATRNLEPGAVIGRKDVQEVALDLPEALARRAIGPSVSVDDAIVLGPVGKGELLQLGNLIKKTGGSGARELSFPIDSAFAAAGRLRPGDRVDIYANRGDLAVPIAANLLVIATSNPPDSAASGRGTIVLTVSYDGTFDGASLLGAAQTAKLSLIRRTGIKGDLNADSNGTRDVNGSSVAPGSPVSPVSPVSPGTPVGEAANPSDGGADTSPSTTVAVP